MTTSEQAATFATRTLVASGQNSWAGGMLRDADATMTMEAWAPDEGSGTYSHPWTASPALIIPRLLMGLAPLEDRGSAGDAWRVVSIRPFPTQLLPQATLAFPSPRGVFVVAFHALLERWQRNGNDNAVEAGVGSRGGAHAEVTLNVTVPGNTVARACFPAYLLQPGYSQGHCSVTLDAEAAVPAAPVLDVEGALLCWRDELSGSHRLEMRCTN